MTLIHPFQMVVLVPSFGAERLIRASTFADVLFVGSIGKVRHWNQG